MFVSWPYNFDLTNQAIITLSGFSCVFRFRQFLKKTYWGRIESVDDFAVLQCTTTCSRSQLCCVFSFHSQICCFFSLQKQTKQKQTGRKRKVLLSRPLCWDKKSVPALSSITGTCLLLTFSFCLPFLLSKNWIPLMNRIKLIW